jgi:uracil-DNA glycosylase family 4
MIKEIKPVNCNNTLCGHWNDPCCRLCTEVIKLDDKPVDLFFIGMGAGKSEDINSNPRNVDRQPWVGKAGSYLRSIVKWMWDNGIEFNIALSNTVRCHPKDEKGKDREPTELELQECLGHLHNDLVDINPRVIITCGASSTRSIISVPYEITIGKVRGVKHLSVFTYNEVPWIVIPTYHPSFLIRTYGSFKPKEKNDYDMKVISDLITALKIAREDIVKQGEANGSSLESTN